MHNGRHEMESEIDPDMSSAVTEKPEYLEGEVVFHRAVQVRPYEVAKAEMRVPFVFHVDDDAEAIIAKGNEVGFAAKAYVLGQLGLASDIEDGILMEVVADAFDGTPVAIETTATPALSAAASSVPAQPPHDPGPLSKPKSQMTDEEKAKADENRAWAEARLEVAPHEFYDNRAKKSESGGNANWPDYKHKETKIGVWKR